MSANKLAAIWSFVSGT